MPPQSANYINLSLFRPPLFIVTQLHLEQSRDVYDKYRETENKRDERARQRWQPLTAARPPFFAHSCRMAPFCARRGVSHSGPMIRWWHYQAFDRGRLNTRLSHATPDAFNYSRLHVTLRNLPVLDTSTKEMRRVKERGREM